LAAVTIYSFNVTKMNSRDSIRIGNMKTINKALSMYFNDKGYYPPSRGECLNDGSVGNSLITNRVIIDIPVDPLWPIDAPSAFNGGATHDYAANPSSDFCYWYYGSSDGTNYYLSYYLESNSKSGNAGINVMSSLGIQ
jgi:type II secretory pathway pseudopilin PulG